eukprot:GFUD01020014.1.p1 GENE.GFUD01020014.1~~GFUD01020014.1.p1  ORF type:complete len:228 (-),score=28.60 GFUD01020014.1:98-781(-)
MGCAGYKDMERWAKRVLVFNICLLVCGIFSQIFLVVWDLTSGVQTITGRCVWAGYCLWIGGLVSLLLCIVFLMANLLAYSGITRTSSWDNLHPSTSYRLLYPWLVLYFILNTGILPTGIALVYLWYEASPSTCPEPRPSSGVCQEDILNLWAPLIGVATLLVLLVFLHNWVIILHLAKLLRKKMNPQPFTRIGSRVVLGLEDTSHGEHSGGSSTLSKGSTLVSYIYP